MQEEGEPGDGSAWTIFASAMIALGGISHLFTGLIMVLNSQWVLDTTDYTSESDVTTLGWINLTIATLMLVTAWGVLSAKSWARAVGVILGVLTVVHGISNLELNPLWGIGAILVGAGIVFALTVKGDADAAPISESRDEGAGGETPER